MDARGLVLLTQAAGASAVVDRREELYRCYIATLNLNGRTPDGVRGEWAGHPQTSSAVCFFGEGPRARRGERVASLAFSLITLILLVRFVCMAERRRNAPHEWRADVRSSNGIVGLVVSLDEQDPPRRADAVSQGNVASLAQVFDGQLFVRRRARRFGASVAIVE